MDKQKLFFGGVPTAPDVKRLLEHFGSPQPRLITHEDVEAVLGITRHTSRYRSVTGAWRKLLEQEHNILVSGAPGGFQILTSPERIDHAMHQRTKGVRRLVRAMKEIVTVPVHELDDRDKHRHMQVQVTTFKALGAAKDAQRECTQAIKSFTPEQLPQRPTPK